MVRALFQVARLKQPAVIFIDEIDSILTQRSDTEHESSRRLKTEFLIQFDGCATQTEDRILVIGVTNRPQELDEAARRRLVKRIYIPLPDLEGRKQLVKNLLREYSSKLTENDFDSIAKMTDGYSGADMNSLCKEAAYGPIRDVGHMLQTLDAKNVRPMQMKDFVVAHRQVRSSVGKSDVDLYEEWDAKFGCHITSQPMDDDDELETSP
ncbi:Fidgetin-like protein 1 [Orchesella cincta]|uniref:Fidgetin-like protein 1 n=1 Tax=Orchesella cincta TaxID=48709 RepID=A0A1D2NJ11_ORCCI|nr:Fidgetin-like protein 1 [Orchesella cincta]